MRTVADSRQLQLLEEFEKRKRVSCPLHQRREGGLCCVSVCNTSAPCLQAKAIAVPTDDSEVKVRLRERREPICEDWARAFAGVCSHPQSDLFQVCLGRTLPIGASVCGGCWLPGLREGSSWRWWRSWPSRLQRSEVTVLRSLVPYDASWMTIHRLMRGCGFMRAQRSS